MVYPLDPRLVKTTRPAEPWMRVKNDRLGLNPRNKEKHDRPPAAFSGPKAERSFTLEMPLIQVIAFSPMASLPVTSDELHRIESPDFYIFVNKESLFFQDRIIIWVTNELLGVIHQPGNEAP